MSKVHSLARLKPWRYAAGMALAAMVLLSAACATPPVADRPAHWAPPVAGQPGLDNLHRVSADLYRSAQPSAEGFAFLSAAPVLVAGDRPIRTIVSLRAYHEDAPLLPAGSSLRIERIGFDTWAPRRADALKFLRIVNTPELQPVLVHCQFGSDRTGTMVALYRIAVQGWSKQEAIAEMQRGGYGYHPIWGNLPDFINGLDIPALQAEARRLGPWPH